MAITFSKLIGDKELAKAFAAMPKKLQRSIIQRGARPALNVVKAEAQRNVRAIRVASGIMAVEQQKRDAKGKFLTKEQRSLQPSTLRNDIAQSMVVSTTRPRGRRKLYGARLKVQYPKRKGNTMVGIARVALAHLLEWGFKHKAAGRKIAGHYYMTHAFVSVRPRAEAMMRRAVQMFIQDPTIKAKEMRRLLG